MRTKNSYFPNNPSVTIPRRRNRRRAPNVVEPENRTIVEVAPMTDNRTMEELLQAPTEGYGEAIVIPEFNADHFEIKTNLLQLVQANPFHGFERENPQLTQIDTFYNGLNENDQDSLYTVTGGNLLSSIAHIQPPVVPILEPDVPKTLPKKNIPYPSRLNDQKLREKSTNQMEKFFHIFQDLHFDINFTDDLLLMPKFSSTIKSLLANKDKLFELAKIPLNENYLAMLLKTLLEKLGDPDKFLIPCDFPGMDMTLELADRSITYPKGFAEDVFVKVRKFYFPTDFVDDEAVTFNLNQVTRYSSTYDDMSINQIDVIDVASEEYAQKVLVGYDVLNLIPEQRIEFFSLNDVFVLPNDTAYFENSIRRTVIQYTYTAYSNLLDTAYWSSDTIAGPNSICFDSTINLSHRDKSY
nr:reverse transcriptase domain-containing protein [Tanacetum cinerariifolium]